MPVSRYRDIADVPVRTTEPLDPENLRRVLAWSAFCQRLQPRQLRAGVTRFRTIEDAAAARSATEQPGDPTVEPGAATAETR